MKSIDKYVLVLVASLALLLAGCGGGSTVDKTPPGPTPGETAIMKAEQALKTAEAGLATAATYEAKRDAHNAIKAAADALVSALTTHGGSDAAIAAATGKSNDAQANAGIWGTLVTAQAAFTTAEGAVDPDGTDAERLEDYQALQTAADALVTALKAAGEDTTAAARTSGEAKGMVASLTTKIAADKKAADDAAKKKAAADAIAMAALAKNLYAGISASGGTGLATRTAEYSGANDINVNVTIGTDTAVPLSEDKETTVAVNQGWEGKKYVGPATNDDMYEAVVYSNVEATKPGKKFGTNETPGTVFQYQLVSGLLTPANANGGTDNFVPKRVALTNVTRTAGTETFKLPSPNPRAETIIEVPGSYHGVSGMYTCTPGTDTCAAQVAASGFTLGTISGTTFTAGGPWRFKPSNANAQVMSDPDTVYASYGWWLKTAKLDGKLTASAFWDVFGDDIGDVAASNLDALNGTATYKGGAAGQYALSSSTGGTNDAGSFTAQATLTADFTNNTTATAITGTIDNFMGADGKTRNWEVKLGGSTIGDNGVIGDTTDGTTWTMNGTAAAAAGQWSGRLLDNGTDNVPKAAAGTFYSTYETAGSMVGAFGVNKQ